MIAKNNCQRSLIDSITFFQIFNQVTLFIALFYMFKCFAGIDSYLERFPEKVKVIISFIAKITLEIYIVQYIIIPKLTFLIFPINWFVITGTIIISGYLLHLIGSRVSNSIESANRLIIKSNAIKG